MAGVPLISGVTTVSNDKKFGIHIVTQRIVPSQDSGEYYQVDFENGYGTSIVRHQYSYGGKDGLFELGVLHNDQLCYDTPITDDVIGYIPEHEVATYLDQIAQLPTEVPEHATN